MKSKLRKSHFLRRANKVRLRPPKGQGLVESACCAVVLVPLAIGLILLLLNAYAISNYNYKLNVAATLSAQAVGAKKYWLGMVRPDYQPEQGTAAARAAAVRLTKALGLPPTECSVQDDQAGDGDVIKVTLTAKRYPLPFGGLLFPSFINLTGTGVNYIASDECYAALAISAPSNQYGGGALDDLALVPAFGFCGGANRGFNGNPYGNLPSIRQGGGLGSVRPKFQRAVNFKRPNGFDPKILGTGIGTGIYSKAPEVIYDPGVVTPTKDLGF